MNAGKIKLSFLLLVTLVPIILATWYYRASVVNSANSTSNKGVLITPLLDIMDFGLVDADGEPAYLSFEEMTVGVDPDDYESRPWQLLFLSSADCEGSCLERLYLLRQIHIRLSKDSERVQRALVLADENGASLPEAVVNTLKEEQPDLRILTTSPLGLEPLLAPSAEGRQPISENFIYVADPLGNIMLYFTPDNTPEEILSDIDRLLDQSSLG